MRRASLGVGSRAAIILLPVHPANRRLVALALPAVLWVAARRAWEPGGGESCKGAGGRLGLRAGWSWPLARAVFRGLDFGKAMSFGFAINIS